MTDAPATPSPVADAFAGHVSASGAPAASAPAPASTPAPPPSASATPNPFADGESFNLTEAGRLLRDAPERARELIHAAGKQKAFATALEKIERDTAKATIERSSALEAATDPDARIAQLEQMRKHNSVLFEVKHADEYKALIEARDAGPQGVRVLDATAAKQKLAAMDGGQELVAEWGDATPAKVQAVQQSTLEMLNEMGSKDAQGAFMFGVSQLPGPVQTGFARELSSPAPENVTPAAADQVAEYKAYGITDAMSVARAEARVQRMIKNLPAGDRVAALGWFRSLPTNQAAAIVKQLSR